MYYARRFQNLYSVERKRIVMPGKVRLRLNRGEIPEELPGELNQHVDEAWLEQQLQQYPSYSEFYEKLARHLGVPKERIVVGAGIEEFIRTIMFLCSDPIEHGMAAVLWPTCAMYDIYAQAFGVNLIRVKPRPGEWFQTPDLINELQRPEISNYLKVLFLPNPGQPVETYFLPYQIEYLAAWCQERHIILAVDEAHYGFGAQSALSSIDKFDNLIVMRTFSKFYGAAAIRVGYVVGSPMVIKPIEAARPSGEIAGPSMAVASVLLDHQELLAERAVGIARGRDWLREEIKGLGLRAWGERGFSLLIEFPTVTKAQLVSAALAQKHVLVKVGFPEPVDRCILLACGQKPMMEEFLKAFKECI